MCHNSCMKVFQKTWNVSHTIFSGAWIMPFFLNPNLLLLYGKVHLGDSAKYLMLFLTEERISYKFGTKTMPEWWLFFLVYYSISINVQKSNTTNLFYEIWWIIKSSNTRCPLQKKSAPSKLDKQLTKPIKQLVSP